jgi:hypothetical protein
MNPDNPQTVRELLPAFYQQYNLDNDGGQKSAYVRIELAKNFALYFPNFNARRKAVLKHDAHHIVTGYTSTFSGETEIGAWEIASGCRQYWVAFALDLHAMMAGLLFNPVGVYKAFIKGRHTRNLYSDLFSDAEIMDMTLSAIQEKLLLDRYPEKQKASFSDILLFIMLILFGLVYSMLSILLLPFIIVYSVYVIIKLKYRRSSE